MPNMNSDSVKEMFPDGDYMNELKIWCFGGPLMYFKTSKKTALEAFRQFEDFCGLIQLNIDNLMVCELELVDNNFNTIDRCNY